MFDIEPNTPKKQGVDPITRDRTQYGANKREDNHNARDRVSNTRNTGALDKIAQKRVRKTHGIKMLSLVAQLERKTRRQLGGGLNCTR